MITQGHPLRGFLVSLILFLLMLIPLSCGDELQSSVSFESDGTTTGSDSQTSSATLIIRWHDDAKDDSLILPAALDCQNDGVENVVCEVYDSSGNWLATGDPWPCSDHSGTVYNIPVGENRIFVGLAMDAAGNIIQQGETPGITIKANEITQGVAIDAHTFIPGLTAPGQDDQTVDPNNCSLVWGSVQNAHEYIVKVAEDNNFQTIIIDDTTADTTYTPSALQPLTEYFWKIQATDQYGNLSLGSEVRSFITTAGNTTSLSGTVVDASTALPLSGVTISVDQGTYTTTTDTSGGYRFDSIAAGIHQVTASMTGYISSSASVTLIEGIASTRNFTLSEYVDSGQYRIVLTWGYSPSDLDSHIWTPDGSHVYYSNKGSESSEPYTKLDVDDTDSYGPETITIYQVQSGTYRYSIDNYSEYPEISGSGANVKLYGQSGLIQEWDVPAGDGLWWNVFTLDGDTGQIASINSISDTAP